MRLIVLKTEGNLRQIQLWGDSLGRANEAQILDFIEGAPNLTVVEISYRKPTDEEGKLFRI